MAPVRRSIAVLALLAAIALGVHDPAGAASSPKICKALRTATIEKVLGAPAKVDRDAQGTQIASAQSCAYSVGPGLGEAGGGLVILTSYKGGVADGIAAEFEPRATSLGKGVVWEPTLEVAYVVKKGKVVGINITYTSSDPPSSELQDEAAKLARAAAKRA
jgi:hypothetical protein